MVTVLIVLGVVVFLAVDAYVIYRVLASHRRADDYGVIEVPGDLTVNLAAGGRLKLNYQESVRAPSDGEGGIEFGVPAGLEVSVTSPSGESLEIRGPGFKGMGASLSTGRNWSRALIGSIEITQPGEYGVSARGELQDAVEPTVLVGK
jgi:hypothetical protein